MSAASGNGKTSAAGSELQKQKSIKRDPGKNATPRCTSSCRFRMPKGKDLSALKCIKNLGEKIMAVLQMMSPRRCSPRVTSSSERVSKPCGSVAHPLDSHRAEAIDDCIEFINSSSSSLPRSNSVTAKS